MSEIVRPDDLWEEMQRWLERDLTQEGYRPVLAEMAPDEDIDRPTVDQLKRHEPQLAELLQEYDRATHEDAPSPDNVWYTRRSGGFRARFRELIGWQAESKDPFLRTTAAYDVAYLAFREIMDEKQQAWDRKHRPSEGEEDN